MKLGEIWHMPHGKGKTRLVLVDALRRLCDKGPQCGPALHVRPQGFHCADPVAVETVCLQVKLKKPRL
jgi:hypothetical protein